MSFGRRNTANIGSPAAVPRLHRPKFPLLRTEQRILKEIAAAIGMLAILTLCFAIHNVTASDGKFTLRSMNRIEYYLFMLGLAGPWFLLRYMLGLPGLSKRRNTGTTPDGGDGWLGGDNDGGCGDSGGGD